MALTSGACGMDAIIEYKGRGYSKTQSSVLLPDELKSFYARFERDSDPPCSGVT